MGEEEEEEQEEEEADAHKQQKGLQLSLGSHPAGRMVPWTGSPTLACPLLGLMAALTVL